MKQHLRSRFGDSLNEVSVDCVMFGFHADELKVLLVKTKDSDIWSLPRGGIFRREPVEDAAVRVLQETTGIEDVFLQQFYTFGAGQRDRYVTASKASRPRGSKAKREEETVISIGYYALVDFEKVVPSATEMYLWCEISALPDLKFDHHVMIELALVALKKDLRYLPIAKLLPRKFTLREMQKLYETILNRTFDRRNFHKLLMGYDFLIKLSEKKTGTANKSPHLYRINFEKYETALQDGISY
jgi:8-oxo-dGTP diphosphatase